MDCRKNFSLLLIVLVSTLFACSPKIHGTVRLVDQNMKPITGESPKDTVINMMNTSVSVEEASYSVAADELGMFESEKDGLTKGIYKVEAGRIGYVTETQTVELGSMTSVELELQLKKIPETKRRSIKRSKSDEDKIINPGEVNIQPPTM